jgi:hypothetical protein
MRTGPRRTGTEGNKDRGADRNGQGTMRIRSKTDMDRDKRGQDQRQSGNAVERTGQKTAKDRGYIQGQKKKTDKWCMDRTKDRQG